MYIYIAKSTYADGSDLHPGEYKIGSTNNLHRRMKEFKREQWAINPTFIRLLVFNKTCGHPDKIIHKLGDTFVPSKMQRIDPHKEFYHIKDLTFIDELFELFARNEDDTRYLMDASDIVMEMDHNSHADDTAEKIVEDILKSIIDRIIREGSDDNPDDAVSTFPLLSTALDVLGAKGKLGRGSEEQYAKYKQKARLTKIESFIPDITKLLLLSQSPEDNYQEIIDIWEETYQKIRAAIASKEIKADPFLSAIINTGFIQYYETFRH